MRTISSALDSAQKADSAIPYIKLVFFSKDGTISYDFSSRCIALEHVEALYNESATITLYNNDRAVPNLVSYWVSIGYGYTTGNAVAEPNGDNNVNEYSYSPRLWVRHQHNISAEGILVVSLELTGIWNIIRDTQMTLGDESSSGGIYQKVYNPGGVGTDTIRTIIAAVLDNISRDTDYPIHYVFESAQNDGILDAMVPSDFTINKEPFDYASNILFDLLIMTKSYLIAKQLDNGTRPPTAGTCYAYLTNRYPQDSDEVDLDLYDTKPHWFFELSREDNMIVPNHIIVFCNKNGDVWDDSLIKKESRLTDQINKFMDMPSLHLAPLIKTASECQDQADALMAKASIETRSGRVIAPHHCGLELLDKVTIHDSRGY